MKSDEERVAEAVEACAERFYLENFEKIETDNAGYIDALRCEMERISNVIVAVEPRRTGWRTKKNRQRWIEKYRTIGLTAFECRLLTLLLRGLPLKQNSRAGDIGGQ